MSLSRAAAAPPRGLATITIPAATFALGFWGLLVLGILLGMLAARGESMLRDVYVINRGYEDLANRLNALGANIEVFRD